MGVLRLRISRRTCRKGVSASEPPVADPLSGISLRWTAACTSLALLLQACATPASLPAGAIAIARQGSFEAGGKVIGVSTQSSQSCDHGHVEYEIPAASRPMPLFLWHSSSAAVWQRSWDGGEGFQTKLLRRGYATYLWDGPRVGRANWGCEDYSYKAQPGRDQAIFQSWRLGPAFGEFYPGIQFPTGDPAAFDQATRARYDEFDTVGNAQIETDAAAKALGRIGPAVLVSNSAGGLRALMTRLKSDNVKGIVAYENPGYVLPDTMETKLEEGPYGPVYVSEAEFARLTEIPIQLVWGDNVADSQIWSNNYARAEQFAQAVNQRGGHVEILRLPDAGLRGNSHIPFADSNNEEVASLLFDWLERKGF